MGQLKVRWVSLELISERAAGRSAAMFGKHLYVFGGFGGGSVRALHITSSKHLLLI